jgi:tripartite-type tricarboxylate transporter receptor subunit TctC
MHRYRVAALALFSLLATTPAPAQTPYPTRPIHIIVPFPAGGPSDVLARLISDKMSVDFKQPVVVENRPGANTVIGAEAAAKASPDGYTLLMAIDSTLVMNQYLYKSLPYDPIAALRRSRWWRRQLASSWSMRRAIINR